jgi:hypothetical protein
MAFAFLIMAATATSIALLTILADPQRRKAACLIGASVGMTIAPAISHSRQGHCRDLSV